jgi:hypothetical protein
MASKKETNKKFYNAIKKYGWDCFVWEVIYRSKDYDHCLNVMEPYFIKEYDSFQNGLNSTVGGDRGPILIGKANGMFGKTHSEKVKKDFAERAKRTFFGKSYEKLLGFERAQKLKKLRSEKAKNKNNSRENNPRFDKNIYTFYNVETGNILNCNRYTFYKSYSINKGGVSDMINNGVTYNRWCVLYSDFNF